MIVTAFELSELFDTAFNRGREVQLSSVEG